MGRHLVSLLLQYFEDLLRLRTRFDAGGGYYYPLLCGPSAEFRPFVCRANIRTRCRIVVFSEVASQSLPMPQPRRKTRLMRLRCIGGGRVPRSRVRKVAIPELSKGLNLAKN